jgi:hypothetical protein
VTLCLVAALLASYPEQPAEKQIRLLEQRLRQFPPKAVAENFVNLSHNHVRWLNEVATVIPVHQRHHHAGHLKEAIDLETCWECLYGAESDLMDARRMVETGQIKGSTFGFYRPGLTEVLHSAERYLDSLEMRLGDDAFQAGRMPPPVPYWRFQRID